MSLVCDGICLSLLRSVFFRTVFYDTLCFQISISAICLNELEIYFVSYDEVMRYGLFQKHIRLLICPMYCSLVFGFCFLLSADNMAVCGWWVMETFCFLINYLSSFVKWHQLCKVLGWEAYFLLHYLMYLFVLGLFIPLHICLWFLLTNPCYLELFSLSLIFIFYFLVLSDVEILILACWLQTDVMGGEKRREEICLWH